MKDLGGILTAKCHSCGRPLEEGASCPDCRPEKPVFSQCMPPAAMTDCDCPVVGWVKVHAPWCKYS